MEIANIKVFSAKDVGDDPDLRTHPVVIEIVETIPNNITFEQAEELFAHEADKLEEALYHALPAGTYVQLLARMLQRKSDQLVIRLC